MKQSERSRPQVKPKFPRIKRLLTQRKAQAAAVIFTKESS